MPLLKPAEPTEQVEIEKLDEKIDLIKDEILKSLAKPSGFDHIEVKGLGNNRYRANVITKVYSKNSLFPVIGRPRSWYVVANDNHFEFNPSLN